MVLHFSIWIIKRFLHNVHVNVVFIQVLLKGVIQQYFVCPTVFYRNDSFGYGFFFFVSLLNSIFTLVSCQSHLAHLIPTMTCSVVVQIAYLV